MPTLLPNPLQFRVASPQPTLIEAGASSSSGFSWSNVGKEPAVPDSLRGLFLANQVIWIKNLKKITQY
jgi:hypothetical protein